VRLSVWRGTTAIVDAVGVVDADVMQSRRFCFAELPSGSQLGRLRHHGLAFGHWVRQVGAGSPLLGGIHVLLAADAAYAKQLAVTIQGISSVVDGRPHVVHVMHDAAQRAVLDPVTECASDDVQVCWVAVAGDAVDRRSASPLLDHPRFYRLRAEWMLPDSIDRVLYFDVDVIVRQSLVGLWETELGHAAVGAVRDAYTPTIAAGLRWRELGVEPHLPYFNSGVLCIPLRRWRDERVGARAEDLIVSGAVGPSDQDALNVVLAGRVETLEPRWNLQTHHLSGDSCPAWGVEPRSTLEAALADPAVVHFCGGTFNRPWVEPSRSPFREQWCEYLDRTPWAGWRPRREAAPRRALRRARRSARVLLRGR